MKIIIEVEVDQAAYDAKYGPGTEWWAAYRTKQVQVTTEDGDKVWEDRPAPAEDYEFIAARAKDTWNRLLRDLITGGLYDWTELGNGVKITIRVEETASP